MSAIALTNLPEVDEWGVPVEKMPDCPVCGEDEMGMISPDMALCYRCSQWFRRDPNPVQSASQEDRG